MALFGLGAKVKHDLDKRKKSAKRELDAERAKNAELKKQKQDDSTKGQRKRLGGGGKRRSTLLSERTPVANKSLLGQ
jgi:hypothetical protein